MTFSMYYVVCLTDVLPNIGMVFLRNMVLVFMYQSLIIFLVKTENSPIILFK